MSTVDRLMEPYVAAESLEEAEAVLDRLAEEGEAPGDVLGECYDDLAEAAAQDKDFGRAARLERRAIEVGFRNREIARQMLAWYLVEGGFALEGEELFARLRQERPDDVGLVIGLGRARCGGGRQADALAAFDEAVALARATGSVHDLERALVERRAEREAAGLEPDSDDRLAPEPRPVDLRGPVVWSVAWFPPDQRGPALERWPDLAEDFEDPVAYARRIESHLRTILEETGQRPSVAPLGVEELAAWSAEHGLDPDSGAARSRFAAELRRTDRAIAWPPGRNDACWCRSGQKYKRCCGTR